MDCSTPGFPVHHEFPELSTPGAYANSCPSSRWCHPTIWSSFVLLSSCLRSFPASGSFPMSQFFTSGDQSIGFSASASVLPMNIQDWFPLGLTDWISLQPKGLSRVSQHHSSKASILWRSAFFVVQFSHPYMTFGKTIALTRWSFVGNVISLLFNMLSSLVIAFLSRSKRNFMAQTDFQESNRLLQVTNKTLCTPGLRRREQWPYKGLAQTCLWVSRN